MMFRGLIPWLIVAWVSVGFAESNLSEGNPVTVYVAKEIVTLDDDQPQVTAIAVKQDRIVAIGDLDSIELQLADGDLMIDRRFADKVLVPGFINQHDHPFLAATMLSTAVIAIEDWQVLDQFYPRAATPAEYLSLLEQRVSQHKDRDSLFVSWGYHRLWHGELNRQMLDMISEDVPIMVWQRSGHELIFNSRALAMLGITETFVEGFPPSAAAQSNWQEGHFWEQGAEQLLPVLFKIMAAPSRYLPALEVMKEYWHRAGATWVVEPGGWVNEYLQQMQNKVFAPADTPFHMDYIVDGKTMAREYLDGDLIGETEKIMAWGEGMSRFLPKQVKLFADGAMYSQLMQMKDGYLDGHHGEWLIEPDIFAEAFARYWDAGYQIHVHTNGDLGVEMLLDVVAENMQRNPRSDHRTVSVHFGFSTPEQVERIKALGVIVSANPYYAVALGEKYSEHGIGPDRAQEMVRLGDLSRAGISFSLHADTPMAPGLPLFLMWCAVNRLSVDGEVIGADQRITPEQALRAVTLEAAYSMQMEQEFGSLQPGKLANITVLDANPLKVDPMAIKDIAVWGTILEGRVLPVKK